MPSVVILRNAFLIDCTGQEPQEKRVIVGVCTP
jgi:hypothetical protein